jgi:hypothetical protein
MNSENKPNGYIAQLKESFNRIRNQFKNTNFQREYRKQFITYGFIMIGYAIIIAVTKYNEVKIDLLESIVLKAYAVTLRQISFLLLMPLSVVAVIPIRNRINAKRPSYLYTSSVIFATIISTLCYYAETNYSILALGIYTCIVRPLFNTLYFYYITDFFYSYNHNLGYIDILLLGITAQSFAAIIKILGFTIFDYIGYNMFVHLGFMTAVALTVRILELYYPSNFNFIPNTTAVNLNTIFRYTTLKKMFRNKFATMIIVNTFIFTLLNEIYGNVKIEHIYLRQVLSRSPVIYGVSSIKVDDMSENNNVKEYERAYISVLFNRIRRLLSRAPANVKQEIGQPNLKVTKTTTTIIKYEKQVKEKENFVHYRETIYETIFCQLFQLIMFMVLTICYNIEKYKNLGPAITYSIVPFFAVINSLLYNNDVLFLVYLFSAIDAGGKKATKEFAYSTLEFESKNFIKLYNEYTVEPVGRLLGGFIGLRLRNLIKTTNGINLNNLGYLRVVSVGLCLTWFFVALYQTYAIEEELKSDKKSTIFED